MKSVEQILSRLESLSSADRRWVVDHLPDHAKTLLMSGLVDGSSTNSLADVTGNGAVEKIPPEIVARVLETESAWVIATLLKSADSSWAGQVLGLLPSGLRSAVHAALRESNSVSAPVLASLRSTLQHRASMEPPPIRSDRPHSGWHRWLRLFGRGAAA